MKNSKTSRKKGLVFGHLLAFLPVDLNLNFVKLEKSSSRTGFLACKSQFQNEFFAGYIGSKNPVWNRQKIQFVELDYSKLIFQKSSSDQQGVWLIQWNWQKTTLWFDYDIQTENRREYLWLFSMEEKVLHVLFDIQKRVIGITITYLPIHTYFSTGLALREIYFDPSILIAKGEIKSEWIYEVINFPKYDLKILKDSCPEVHRAKILQLFLVIFWKIDGFINSFCLNLTFKKKWPKMAY